MLDKSMIDVLIHLYKLGGSVKSRVILQLDLRYSNTRFDRVINALENMKLIEKKPQPEAPPRVVIELTEKGRGVARHLIEIEKILNS